MIINANTVNHVYNDRWIGLSRQVVFHDSENTYDFAKTIPEGQ